MIHQRHRQTTCDRKNRPRFAV